MSSDAPSTVATAIAAVAADPAGDHSVAALAGRVGVSRRHLARLFDRHLHCPPAQFVELVRVCAACRLLATSDEPVRAIGLSVGFASTETMRRAFLRRLGVSPGHYRRRVRRADDVGMAGSEGSMSLPTAGQGPTIGTCSSCPE
jgi:transcriptional regulator GlxA family with amidase domain